MVCGAPWGAARLCTLPHAVQREGIWPSSTPFLLLPSAWFPPAVQVLPVCAPPSCGTLLVCYGHREHTTDPLRPLSAHADAACSTDQVGDPCSHIPLSGDARHGVHDELPHRTRRNHARCVGAVLLVRHAGARLPIARAGSSSGGQLQRERGQAETPAADRQGQRRTDHLEVRKWQRVPGREGDHLYLRRVFQVGCVPGTTDGSMPVGSGEFIHSSL